MSEAGPPRSSPCGPTLSSSVLPWPEVLRRLARTIHDDQLVRLAGTNPELGFRYLPSRVWLRPLVEELTPAELATWAKEVPLIVLACVRELVPARTWDQAFSSGPPKDESVPSPFMSALACMVITTRSELWEPDPMAPPPTGWWEYTLEDGLDEWVACINVATLPPGAYKKALAVELLSHWYEPCRQLGMELVGQGP